MSISLPRQGQFTLALENRPAYSLTKTEKEAKEDETLDISNARRNIFNIIIERESYASISRLFACNNIVIPSEST
jgi:hypothetical protein